MSHTALVWWRALMISAGMFDLGAGLMLFLRIWRYALPKTTTRMILVGAALAVGVCLGELYDRIHAPVTWRTPLVSTAVILLAVGLVRLYVWSRRPEGRRVRHQMIADHAAAIMLREANHEAAAIMLREAEKR